LILLLVVVSYLCSIFIIVHIVITNIHLLQVNTR